MQNIVGIGGIHATKFINTQCHIQHGGKKIALFGLRVRKKAKSIGHEPEFWNNMKYLLAKGKEIGVYKKHDYKNKPVDYCGTKITNTPEDD